MSPRQHVALSHTVSRLQERDTQSSFLCKLKDMSASVTHYFVGKRKNQNKCSKSEDPNPERHGTIKQTGVGNVHTPFYDKLLFLFNLPIFGWFKIFIILTSLKSWWTKIKTTWYWAINPGRDTSHRHHFTSSSLEWVLKTLSKC